MTSIDVPDRVAADKVDIGRRAARVDLGVRAVGRSRQLTRVRDVAMAYLGLTKPRIIELLLVTTVPAMFLAAGGVPPLTVVLTTMIGGCLAAASANAFNCVLDRDIDERMRRTRRRPLPRHAVGPLGATVFGMILGIAATLWLGYLVNWLSAALALGANAFYIVVYTLWLKRRTPQNIIWGGIAGCFPPLIGWTAVTGSRCARSLRDVPHRVLLDPAAHVGARHALSGGLRGGERTDAAGAAISPGGGSTDHGFLGGDSAGLAHAVASGTHRLVLSRGRDGPRRRAAVAVSSAARSGAAWPDRCGTEAHAALPLDELLSRAALRGRRRRHAAALTRGLLAQRRDHAAPYRRHRSDDAQNGAEGATREPVGRAGLTRVAQ